MLPEHERSEVIKWCKALVGDLIAGDEEPTHYNSWFLLREAMMNLKIAEADAKARPHS